MLFSDDVGWQTLCCCSEGNGSETKNRSSVNSIDI